MSDHKSINEDIAILGGGSMGTALAKLLADDGHRVRMWVFEEDLAERIRLNRENDVFLPGEELPENLEPTSSLEEALAGVETVLSVTPAQHLRAVWERARDYLDPSAMVVCASKGVETGTALLMSQVLEEVLPDHSPERFSFLSGPSFAKEIVAGHPTAVVVACTDEENAQRVQELTSTRTFRTYTTDDVVGVELGGALKNVIAIAVGIARGMGLGHNSRAGLITRGLAEVSRLAVACGANPLTLAGLAGVGDLVLTCTGQLSRNLQVGMRLGEGETLDEILGGMKMVAEGVATSRSAKELALRHDVEMPITEMVVDLLDGKIAPDEAVRALMSRRLKAEREW